VSVDEKSMKLYYRIAYAIAVLSFAFSVIVGIRMVSSLATARTASPLNMPEIEQLRAALKDSPADESLRNKIRDLDVVSRRLYFSGVTSLRTGTFLLLGGLVFMVVSLKIVSEFRKEMPDPREYSISQDILQSTSTARWVIAGMGVILLTGVGVIGLMERQGTGTRNIPKISGIQKEKIIVSIQPATPEPSAGEFVANWPAFRGPSRCGTASYTNLPVSWDAKSGKGILWKVAVPLPGMSSPVVWGNRVFVTGATEKQREIYCYETGKGTLLWKMGVDAAPGNTNRVPKVSKDTGFAAPTCVVDGKIVYAIFANGDVAAVDFCSQKMWTVDLGLPANRYGYSSSPVIHGGNVLVQYDGVGDGGNASRLIALDAVTGKKAWSVARPVSESWPSPILIDTGKGLQLVTMANEFIIAHNPATGEEIWRVKCRGSDVAPSPIYAGGLVLATVTYDLILAIRPDGRGDVTKTHVVWKSEDGVSDVASPVSNGELAFFVHSGGTVTCLDVKTGKIVWDKSLEAEFYSSPALSGDRVYLVARNGRVFIFKAGRKYEEIGTANLGELSDCSPAFVDGRIFVRGITNLFCIGNIK